MRIVAIFFLFLFSISSYSADQKTKNVRYKSGKHIDFQSLLIEGEKKKADYSVVTGNLGETDFGLLKLRENFHDFMALDHKEAIKENMQ